jgi:hypothetical protein
MMRAEERLARTAVAQAGAFTRDQALAAGFTPAQIERRVRAGAWERVLPRVYRHASTPASTTFRFWAAVLWAGRGSALSHASAATVWRIPGVATAGPELIVPGARAPRVAGVVVHRAARIDETDVVRVHRLPVTSPARTVIDLAGVLDDTDLALAVAGVVSRRLVTVRALGGRLDEIGTVGRPGSARLRALLVAIGSGGVEPSARMAG